MTAGCSKKSPPIPADAISSTSVAQSPEPAIVKKAKSIVLPEFKLDGVKFSEALRLLSLAAKQNDPEHKGVNVMSVESATVLAGPNVTLALTNMTVLDTIDCLSVITHVHVSVNETAFVFDEKPAKL